MSKLELRVTGKFVEYWNGKKWLTKETLSSKKKAEKLLIELNKYYATRNV